MCAGKLLMKVRLRGAGVRNLSIAKHSLMAKHIFKYLNTDATIWVDILLLKYGKINLWKDPAPAKCSWFFRGLFNSAVHIKSQCRLISINPSTTCLLWDPWCFDVPIAFKPTYVNVNAIADGDFISFSNLIVDDRWNFANLSMMFGSNNVCNAVNSSSIYSASAN